MDMERRSFIKLSVLSAGCIAAGLSSCAPAPTMSTSPVEAPPRSASQGAPGDAESQDPIARIMVMSDTHFDPEVEQNNAHYRAAFADIGAMDPKPDAVVIAGDITYTSEERQYQGAVDIAASYGFTPEDNLVLVMGNHDQDNTESTSDADFEPYRRLFARFATEQNVYYDRTVSGQHIVVLGPDDQEGLGWISFKISQTQLDWLESKLAEDAQRNVPTLVVMHEPLSNTVRGSLEGQFAHSIVANDAELRAVIDRYPRTVYVSGHSHAYPDIQQIDGTGPLFVNDGAVATGQRVPDTRSYNGAFGWLITVYSDRIDFALRDFLERTWVDGSLYTHTLP